MTKKNVDLGTTSKKVETEEKQKLVYMSIQTGLMFILELVDVDKARKYALALADGFTKSFSKQELKQEIFKLFGVKTVNELKEKHLEQYEAFTKIFGAVLWGEDAYLTGTEFDDK